MEIADSEKNLKLTRLPANSNNKFFLILTRISIDVPSQHLGRSLF